MLSAGLVHEDAQVQVDPESGLLRGVRQVASPNCDSRPAGVEPDLIVVHGISLPPGEFGGPWIDRLFTNALPADAHPYFARGGPLRVSSHLVIRPRRHDHAICELHERAWHAGQSSYNGREACNDFSIGMELEGTDTLAYEAAQYQALADVVAALCAAYPDARARAPGRPQRYLAGAQDRSRSGLRLAAGPPPDRRRLRGAAPCLSSSGRSAPEHFAARLVTRKHTREHEQQVG